ncbi:uncharacterized protein LAESUDRAFT_648541 [Laetiporus sulphureus 93-53]|uniref:S-adenosyl-L-methionine-dependent methyltransferase n=1 Tax=Laetiporus sulphureus 93-53 TaxID=1314785 RepID=A0A165F7T5_9APHY|nr:uncharacterized protein LAESUDRAFT_648541 [Laetiporus sulphureus 93-53]KZT08561.1 hypothetical protein LAESUDRAFT_648541 [Laetiporus sulphureus 93-53]
MLTDSLLDVLRGFASLCPSRLQQPPLVGFKEFHDFLLHSILLNPHFQQYPPSKQYQASFWKWAIGLLERLVTEERAEPSRKEDEIDGRIYERMTSLVIRPSVGKVSGLDPPEESYVTYIWKTDPSVSGTLGPGLANATLMESRTLIESGTTGLKTWTAALVLAHYLTEHPELIRKKRILELGSGVGFLGIVIATLQLHSCDNEVSGTRDALFLTDVNDAVLRRCQENVRLPCNRSSQHASVGFRSLDWTDAMDSATRPAVLSALLCDMDPDVIVGADVVYDPDIIAPLVCTLSTALESGKLTGSGGAVAYIALTVRNEETLALFLEAAGTYSRVV